MKNLDNCNIRFSRNLGSRNIFVPRFSKKGEIVEPTKYIFSGDDYVLEVNYKTNINMNDMKVLMMLVLDFQNNKSDWSNFYEDNFDMESKKNRFIEIYKDVKDKDMALEILQKEIKDIGDYSLGSISKTISLNDYLRHLNMKAQKNNRDSLISSIESLFNDVSLKWYILNSNQKEELKSLKKHKKYNDYKNDILNWFLENKDSMTERNRHLILGYDIEKKTDKVTVHINKEFARQTLRGVDFDFSFMLEVKSAVGQALLSNLSFGFKSKISLDYLLDMINLNPNLTDRKKLFEINKGFAELVDKEYFKSVTYDKNKKMFSIVKNYEVSKNEVA